MPLPMSIVVREDIASGAKPWTLIFLLNDQMQSYYPFQSAILSRKWIHQMFVPTLYSAYSSNYFEGGSFIPVFKYSLLSLNAVAIEDWAGKVGWEQAPSRIYLRIWQIYERGLCQKLECHNGPHHTDSTYMHFLRKFDRSNFWSILSTLTILPYRDIIGSDPFLLRVRTLPPLHSFPMWLPSKLIDDNPMFHEKTSLIFPGYLGTLRSSPIDQVQRQVVVREELRLHQR